MLPEEDRGPGWLRDWQAIEVDLQALEDFAVKLRAEVEVNFAPHFDRVKQDMAAEIPPPAQEFAELSELLVQHYKVATLTTGAVHTHGLSTNRMASAAATVSRKYGEADAFAAARAGDVEATLHGYGLPAPPATAPGEDDPTSGEH
ncbi:MAG TPA: hypothetical protein VNV66_05780 [Pilimelia sp.]|nr:hypothetical protein [Pilimelia sp.]